MVSSCDPITTRLTFGILSLSQLSGAFSSHTCNIYKHLVHFLLHISHNCVGYRGVKYYELQEAWVVAKATSVLTVPIPAVRTYESASIADTTPPLEETACDPASHVCPVLHSLNGAVGVLTLGMATEDIDLDGRYAALSCSNQLLCQLSILAPNCMVSSDCISGVSQ